MKRWLPTAPPSKKQESLVTAEAPLSGWADEEAAPTKEGDTAMTDWLSEAIAAEKSRRTKREEEAARAAREREAFHAAVGSLMDALRDAVRQFNKGVGAEALTFLSDEPHNLFLVQ